MKCLHKLLVTAFFVAVTYVSAEAKTCDPAKKSNGPSDTTAVKKKPVKIDNTTTVQPKKQTTQKEEKKTHRDLVSPLPWFPTFVY